MQSVKDAMSWWGIPRSVTIEPIVPGGHTSFTWRLVHDGESSVVKLIRDAPVFAEPGLHVAAAVEQNAFLTGVLYDGERVQAVKRFGRYRSAAVRSALLVERVLQDGQVVCAIEGCDRTAVYWDHIVARADDGFTEIINLQPLCAAHHREKTVRETRERRARRAREQRSQPRSERDKTRRRARKGGPAPP